MFDKLAKFIAEITQGGIKKTFHEELEEAKGFSDIADAMMASQEQKEETPIEQQWPNLHECHVAMKIGVDILHLPESEKAIFIEKIKIDMAHKMVEELVKTGAITFERHALAGQLEEEIHALIVYVKK